MKKQDWINIWCLFKDVVRYEKKTVINGVVAALLGAVKPFIYTVLLGSLIDMVYEGKGWQTLLRYILITICGKFVLEIVHARAQESFNQKLENPKELGTAPLNYKALTMDYEYLEETRVQELRFRSFTKSYYGVSGWLINVMYYLIDKGASVLIALVIVMPLYTNNRPISQGFIGSALYSVLLILFTLGVSYINYKTSVNCTRKAKEIFDSFDTPYNKKHYYMDLFAGIEVQKDIRMNHYQSVLEQDVDGLFDEIQKNERKQGSLYLHRAFVQQTISKLSAFMIYLFTGLRSYIGMITIGNTVTYAGGMVQFSNAIEGFANAMGHVKSVAMYAADYREFISLDKKKYPGTIPLEKRRDNRFLVEFEHVSFKYPGSDAYVIKDLNLSFVIGEKMAIIGKNGSGKTTFIKLLCRLYDVTEGCIKVNGIDIRKYDYKEYCNLFAVVFQDFHIFSLPLGENIAASSQVDEERAYDALTRAGLGERLAGLSQGLAVYVGKEFDDNGVSFSGGEKQKMAIARAIYKDAPFVIMDEPTAALDPISECEVYAGFDKMVGNKTALYISHRLASCRFCEDILVFDQGQVVQRGNHDTLIREEGLYRDLWNAQAQYYAC